MSTAFTRPDFKADIADLQRRIDALERRLTPRPATGTTDSHDGTGEHAVAIAHSDDTANATATDAIAVGRDAFANGEISIGIGYSSDAEGAGAVSIGPHSSASSEDATAVGHNAGAGDEHAVAVGEHASAPALNSTAVGGSTVADAEGAVALGYQADAGHSRAVAVGNGAATTGANIIMLGASVHRTIIRTPNSFILNSLLPAGSISFYLDEGTNILVVAVKYSDNTTTKTGTVALT